MLPQSNGQLMQINADSQSDDWDAAAGAGTPKWVGPTPTYVKETIRTVYSENAGALVRFRDVTLYIDETLPVDIFVGDIVTYTDPDGKQHTRRVQVYTHPTMPQIPTGQSYRRLVLESEKTES